MASNLVLKLPDDLVGKFTAEPVTVAPGQSTAVFKLTRAKGAECDGDVTVAIRGTAMQDGKYAVVSEAPVTVETPAK